MMIQKATERRSDRAAHEAEGRVNGRGVGSKSRIRVRRVVGSLGAFDPQNTYRNCSLDPLFLGPRMRDVYRNFVFRGSTS